MLAIAQLLALLVVANGTPIIAAKIFGKFLALPIDGGRAFVDGKPLFGSSKTLRGLVLSIVVTSVFAPLIGLDWRLGTLVATLAILATFSPVLPNAGWVWLQATGPSGSIKFPNPSFPCWLAGSSCL